MKLSARRTRFVDEYILDHNGSAAARRAGYSVDSAHVAACRLLRNDNVITAIDTKKHELAQQYEINKHGVVRELFSAVAMARDNLDAGNMIRAWCEIAKILGIYSPEPVKEVLYAENEALRAEYDAMTDDQLLAIINAQPTLAS